MSRPSEKTRVEDQGCLHLKQMCETYKIFPIKKELIVLSR